MLRFVILFHLLERISARSVCFYSRYNYYYSPYQYCVYYSSSSYNSYDYYSSLDDSFTSSSISAGKIAGIVIGSLVGVSLLLVLIAAICACNRRARRNQGQVIAGSQPHVAFVNTPNSTATSAPIYPQPYGGNYNAGYATGQPAYYPPNYYPATQQGFETGKQPTADSLSTETSQAENVDPLTVDNKQ